LLQFAHAAQVVITAQSRECARLDKVKVR